jgi:hypothetical protein
MFIVSTIFLRKLHFVSIISNCFLTCKRVFMDFVNCAMHCYSNSLNLKIRGKIEALFPYTISS